MSRLVPDPMLEPTITPPQAAEILEIGPRSAYNAIARGEMPSIRVGRTIRVPTARFLEQYGLEPSREPVPAA
jgi:excisionase family DNA binding protein